MADSLRPPVLNPSQLYKEEAKRDATRIRIYNMVLSQIYNKVKAVARIPGNERSLMYVIPEFIPGTPRFDLGDATIYIVWNLRNAGYEVSYTYPNLLVISWRSYDSKYQEHTSPWSQVLNSVRGTVSDTMPSLFGLRPATAPSTVQAQAAPIIKRKTVLKKTNEYMPSSVSHGSFGATTVGTTTATGPMILGSRPTVAAALSIPRLPGQLNERHVSFV